MKVFPVDTCNKQSIIKIVLLQLIFELLFTWIN